jgi:hypothetical protein
MAVKDTEKRSKMTDFHMPDGWYEPPDEPEPCEGCNDEGCIRCDASMAADHWADIRMQAIKEGEV